MFVPNEAFINKAEFAFVPEGKCCPAGLVGNHKLGLHSLNTGQRIIQSMTDNHKSSSQVSYRD